MNCASNACAFAKAVKYGGVEPHEALKFITLNPAKQLGIDHRTGSLEGQHADFTHPEPRPFVFVRLVQETWIEGACYFSREKDAEVQKIAMSGPACLANCW